MLDTLLADPRVEFEGFSGSSAGVTNAVVVANGWVEGGRGGTSRLGPLLDGRGVQSTVSAMQSLAVDADRFNALPSEVLTAPDEQGKVVAQVGATVGGIDQTTQQSAALAERRSAAASALADQALGLAAEFASRKLPLAG